MSVKIILLPDLRNIGKPFSEPVSVRKPLVCDTIPKDRYFNIGQVRQVGNGDLLIYHDPDKPRENVYKIIDITGRYVGAIVSDENFYDFGRFSPDFSKVYYLKSGQAHRYDVPGAVTEKTFPKQAYWLLKNDTSEDMTLKATRKNDIFYRKPSEGEYQLIDINDGSVLKNFTVPDNERILDIAFRDDKMLIFSTDYDHNYMLRDGSGGVTGKITAGGKYAFRTMSAWNPESRKICLIKRNTEKSGRRYSRIWFEVLLWDFGKQTVSEFTLSFPVK